MSVIRFRPVIDNALQSRSDLNTMFDTVFKWLPGPLDSSMWRPQVDLHEYSDKYVIDVELAGVAKDDVTIKFDNDTLSISGVRSSLHTGSENDPNATRIIERLYGKFSRVIRMPKDVDADAIVAAFNNGVLSITVAKKEDVQPKQIAIS